MSRFIIFKMWRHPLPVVAVLATTAFILLWPSLPLKGVMNWLRFFYYYTPQNYLYSIMAMFSGLYVGVYAYNKKVLRCCSVENMKTGASGSILGILLGACPACIPVLAFLFPLSVTIVLSRLSLIFLIISVVIMAFSLWKVGGFQKASN